MYNDPLPFCPYCGNKVKRNKYCGFTCKYCNTYFDEDIRGKIKKKCLNKKILEKR